MKPTELAQLAILGAVAFVLYTVFRKFQTGAGAVTEPLARAWVNLTAPPPPQILGRIKLPDGRQITVQQLVDAGGRITGTGLFMWGGVQYQITGRDASDAYVTKRIIT